jgi:DNA anti-recombination protein RmuC
MRTISNLWRQEYQSRNAVKIAKQAGRLYDKFAGFVADLEDIGSKLRAAQATYDAAHNKLALGHGNIVSRVENLRLLGARAKKGLPADLVEDAMEDNETQVINVLSPEPIDKATRALSLDGGGLFPDLVAADEPGAVDTFEDESLPLLSSKSAAVGEK